MLLLPLTSQSQSSGRLGHRSRRRLYSDEVAVKTPVFGATCAPLLSAPLHSVAIDKQKRRLQGNKSIDDRRLFLIWQARRIIRPTLMSGF